MHTYAQGLAYVEDENRTVPELYAFAAALGKAYASNLSIEQLRARLRRVLRPRPNDTLPEPASNILRMSGGATTPRPPTRPRQRPTPTPITPERPAPAPKEPVYAVPGGPTTSPPPQPPHEAPVGWHWEWRKPWHRMGSSRYVLVADPATPEPESVHHERDNNVLRVLGGLFAAVLILFVLGFACGVIEYDDDNGDTDSEQIKADLLREVDAKIAAADAATKQQLTDLRKQIDEQARMNENDKVYWQNQITMILSKSASTQPSNGNGGATPTGSNGNGQTGGTLYAPGAQPYVPHPSLYVETGTPCQLKSDGTYVCENIDAHTKRWTFEVLPQMVAVVGGYTVDGKGGGVYKGYGPGTYTVTVTDGFLSIVENKWGQNEWCFRIGEAVKYKWAHATEAPLSGWTCGGTTSTSASQTISSRTITGDGKTLSFPSGADVIGVDIVLDNGTVYHGCRLANAPTSGRVTTGVIYPNKDEIAASKPCN